MAGGAEGPREGHGLKLRIAEVEVGTRGAIRRLLKGLSAGAVERVVGTLRDERDSVGLCGPDRPRPFAAGAAEDRAGEAGEDASVGPGGHSGGPCAGGTAGAVHLAGRGRGGRGAGRGRAEDAEVADRSAGLGAGGRDCGGDGPGGGGGLSGGAAGGAVGGDPGGDGPGGAAGGGGAAGVLRRLGCGADDDGLHRAAARARWPATRWRRCASLATTWRR